MTDTKIINAKFNLSTAKRRAVASPSLPTAIIAAVALAVAVVPTPILARDVLFLGVTDVRGGSAEPELEAALRAEFAADKRFRLIGKVETERAAREMERQGRARTEAIIPANVGLADSTVIVRGVLRELSIVTKRSSLLLWGRIDARMRLEVHFSEFSGSLSHREEFSATASKRKDVILFQDPKKTVHVSATDREELLGRMRADLVKSAVGLTGTVFNAIATGGALPAKATKDSADTADGGAEFSTVNGKDVAPIGDAGATNADSGK